MSKAAKRFILYHLAFLEANREEYPRILDEFDQITRSWTMAQEIAGLFESENEREEALLDFVRHLHNMLAVQGL